MSTITITERQMRDLILLVQAVERARRELRRAKRIDDNSDDGSADSARWIAGQHATLSSLMGKVDRLQKDIGNACFISGAHHEMARHKRLMETWDEEVSDRFGQ